MRQAYVLHLLDHVIQERQQVYLNDMAIADEMAPDEKTLTVNNVFEIAKQLNGEEISSSSESE